MPRNRKADKSTNALPILKIFCLCEKVILADDGTASLVTLLERVIVNAVSGKESTDILTAPIKWHVFSFWERKDTSQLEVIKIRSRVIVGGKNIEPLESELPVTFAPGHRTMKVNQPFFGLPVKQNEINEITMSVLIGENEWEERGRLQVEVTFQNIVGG